MRDFWNRKGAENPTYYISSYRPYDDQDEEEFWRWGGILAERYLDESSIAFTGSESVLDVGCGMGRFTRAFADRFAEAYGIDISERMIELGREALAHIPNVKLVVGNGTDLSPFEDNRFDFVFSYITLQHIPDVQIVEGYIREFGRVLKDGGWSYFQASDWRPGLRARLKLRARLQGLTRILTGDTGGEDSGSAGTGPTELDSPAWKGSSISAAQVVAACREGGLEVLTMSGEGTQSLWIKAQKAAASL